MTVHPAASNMSIDRDPREGTTHDGPDKKQTRFNFLKEELANLLGANLLTLDIVVGGQTVEAYLDTGATIRFGPPRSPVAILSPWGRLPVAVLALLAPCRSPVACLSLSCRSPVAPLSLPCRFPLASLSLSCRFPVASCCFLLFPVAMLIFAWRLPVALLSLFPVASLSPSCRLPVVFLPPPRRLPVASLSPNAKRLSI